MSSDATLAQVKSILDLLDQRHVSRQRLQYLLASGILSDMFDKSARLPDRDSVREVLGIEPIYEKLVCGYDGFPIKNGDMIKEGWSLWLHTSDEALLPGRYSFKLMPAYDPVTPQAAFSQLVAQAVKYGVSLGRHRHAELIMSFSKSRIPPSWVGRTILFPGTIWFRRDQLDQVVKMIPAMVFDPAGNCSVHLLPHASSYDSTTYFMHVIEPSGK